jgi:hypothetical protein
MTGMLVMLATALASVGLGFGYVRWRGASPSSRHRQLHRLTLALDGRVEASVELSGVLRQDEVTAAAVQHGYQCTWITPGQNGTAEYRFIRRPDFPELCAMVPQRRR